MHFRCVFFLYAFNVVFLKCLISQNVWLITVLFKKGCVKSYLVIFPIDIYVTLVSLHICQFAFHASSGSALEKHSLNPKWQQIWVKPTSIHALLGLQLLLQSSVSSRSQKSEKNLDKRLVCFSPRLLNWLQEDEITSSETTQVVNSCL